MEGVGLTKLVCTSCGQLHKAPFHPLPEDYACSCGGRRTTPFKANPRKPLARVSEKKAGEGRQRGSTLKRTRRRETAAEKRARQHFNATVKSWPCWFRKHRPCEACEGAGGECDPFDAHWIECHDCEGDGEHRCSGPKDAHHLVEKQWIRRNYADLPEDELLAILHCPQIGAPLCRYNAHEQIKKRRIYFHELTAECIEFCSDVDRRYLNRLTPAGARRLSMLERLKVECPLAPKEPSGVGG